MNEDYIKTVLGTHSRARRQEWVNSRLDDYFLNPLIHREIHGDKIYVPLDLDRIWNKTVWDKQELTKNDFRRRS